MHSRNRADLRFVSRRAEARRRRLKAWPHIGLESRSLYPWCAGSALFGFYRTFAVLGQPSRAVAHMILAFVGGPHQRDAPLHRLTLSVAPPATPQLPPDWKAQGRQRRQLAASSKALRRSLPASAFARRRRLFQSYMSSMSIARRCPLSGAERLKCSAMKSRPPRAVFAKDRWTSALAL